MSSASGQGLPSFVLIKDQSVRWRHRNGSEVPGADPRKDLALLPSSPSHPTPSHANTTRSAAKAAIASYAEAWVGTGTLYLPDEFYLFNTGKTLYLFDIEHKGKWG